jgi:hypothetical protein
MRDSHTIDGPAGRFLFEGARSSDKTFVHGRLGVLNITRAWELSKQDHGRDLRPEQLCITPQVRQCIEEFGNKDGVPAENMPPEQRDEPMLLVEDDQGQMFIIDGLDRLLARAGAGFNTVSAFVLGSCALPEISVLVWKVADNGSRMHYDLSQ